MADIIIPGVKFNHLEMQATFTINKTNLKKSETFKYKPFGDVDAEGNTTVIWVHFKDFLLDKASSTLESPEMVVHEYRLTERLSGFDICGSESGDVTMCLSSPEVVLIVLYNIIQNEKYRDYQSNIVYFMHEDLLYSAHCRWDGFGWICDASPVTSYLWKAGERVFWIATEN